MQVIDMPPNYENYPEHDHAEDGQEEVFLAMRGGGEIEIDGERFPLDPDHMARVAPAPSARSGRARRGSGCVIVGGVPGAVYEAPGSASSASPTRWRAERSG